MNLILGLFSKLMTCGIVVAKIGAERFWASLGHATWGGLLWPLRVNDRDEDGMHTWEFDEHGQAEWVFLTDPLSWHGYAHCGIRITKGIALKQIGPPEVLIKCSLRQQSILSHADLVRLAGLCRLDVYAWNSRDELLESLANHFAPGDTSYLEEIKSKKTTVAECLVEDPLFEAAYEALDEDDKREFPEVREARQKGKKRNFEEALNYRKARAKATAKAKARTRAKAKAKAHAAPGADAVAPRLLPPPPPPPVGPLVVVEPVPPPPPVLGDAAGPAPVSRIPAHALRGDRSMPFGTSWVLSEVHPGGVFTTWSCSCYIHTVDGQRSSYPFTMGRRWWPDGVKYFGFDKWPSR